MVLTLVFVMHVAASAMDILQGADATLYRPSLSVLDLLGFGFWVFQGSLNYPLGGINQDKIQMRGNFEGFLL